MLRIRHILLLAGSSILSLASQAQTAPYRSVIEFGADGSDDRDDTQSIQAALAALSGPGKPGGVLFFPAGHYYLNDTLVVTQSGVTLLGEGRGSPNDRSVGGSLLVLRSAPTGTAVAFRETRFSGLRNLGVYCADGLVEKGPRRKEPALLLQGTYHSFVREVSLASVISGIEVCDGIAPVVEDVSIKSPSGDFGLWLHGSGMVEGRRRKVDAAHFSRLSGGAGENSGIEWVIFGPNVDGAKIQDARFVAGSRGLVLRGGDEALGDTRPKYIYADKFGCDHVTDEGVLIEAGNDVFMNNTWIGQNKNASGIVIGPGFAGGALFTDTRVRGAGGHGLHVQGGRNIYIQNPLIGTNGTNRRLVPRGSTEAAGILIENGVKNLRVTGGGVCPMYESGSSALQHYGVRYLGDEEQARKDSVRISGVDTTGNPVPFAPSGLSLDAR